MQALRAKLEAGEAVSIENVIKLGKENHVSSVSYT